MQITIAGNVVTIQHGSLDVMNAIGQRSTIQKMTVLDYTGTQRYFQGQPISITDDNGHVVFTGFLTQDKKVRTTQTTTQEHSIQAGDNHYLADKRLAAYVAQNKSLQAIAYDYIAQFLGSEGVYAIKNVLSANQSDVETDTTGFVALLSATLSRDTTTFWHGAASLKVVTPGTVTGEGVRVAVPASTTLFAGLTYTISAYLWGSGNVTLIGNGDTLGDIGSGQNIALTPTPTRYSVTFTLPATISGNIGLVVRTNGVQALTWHADGMQLEPLAAASVWELGGTSTVQTGPTIVNYLSAYAKCSEGFDALVQNAGAGWYWQIDNQRRLWIAVQISAPPAPFTVDDTTGDTIERGTDNLTHGNPQYRNTQYMLGGTATTATQTETRHGDGTTQAFTMSYQLAQAPTITLNGVSQTVGLKGSTGSQWYWAQGDPVIAQDTSGVKLISTDALQAVYVGQYASVALSQDQSAVATQQMREGIGTGVVEAAATDTSITSASQAFQSAAGYLSKYAQDLDTLQFMTKYYGLQEGQLLTVNIPAHNLNNAQMLIQSVEITDVGPIGAEIGDLWYLVTAVSGPINQTWQQFYAALAGQSQQIVNSIQIGQAQSLTILAQFTALWNWSATHTPTVFVCPICGPTTLCGPSTKVC